MTARSKGRQAGAVRYNTLDGEEPILKSEAVNETRLRVPATSDGVVRLAAAFDAFAVAMALPEAAASAAQVALDELLSNTVRAGFRAGETGHIDAEFKVMDDVLQISLTDNGVAFDPFSRADPDTQGSLESRPIGGLGIYFVKRLMDSVSYERVGEENRVSLRKRIIRS